MKNVIKKDFTMVPNALIEDEAMLMEARFLFVWLCSRPEDWTFYNKKIEAALGCGKDSRVKYTKVLIDFGWITVEQQKLTGGAFGPNEITLNPYPKKPTTAPHPIFSATENIGGGKNPPLNKKNLKQKESINKKETDGLFESGEIISMPEKVLQYLNEKKGLTPSQGYKPTASNLKHIKARFKEKFTFEDMSKVVDAAIIKWSDDAKMKQYIRPETLFGDKMNTYLLESESVFKTASSSNAGSGNFKDETIDTPEML